MYALGVTGLIAAYVLIALLLLSINLYSNWSWKVKACSIVVATLFYVITYLSFPPLLGWPTGEQPPYRFRLVAADVVQPDKLTGAKGMVYLWLRDLDDLSGRTRPRAYKLPYSTELHEAIINREIQAGKRHAATGRVQGTARSQCPGSGYAQPGRSEERRDRFLRPARPAYPG